MEFQNVIRPVIFFGELLSCSVLEKPGIEIFLNLGL